MTDNQKQELGNNKHVYCQKCGKQNDIREGQQRVFCQYCGTQIELLASKDSDPTTVIQVQNIANENDFTNDFLAFIKKYWKILLPSFAVFLLIIIIIISVVSCSKPKANETSAKATIPTVSSVEVTTEEVDIDVKSPISSKNLESKNYSELQELFENAGFKDVTTESLDDLLTADLKNEDKVKEVSIDNKTSFSKDEKFKSDVSVVIKYHSAKKIYPPISSEDIDDQNYEDIVTQFKNAGFTNVTTRKVEDLITGFLHDDGDVDEVSINGETEFDDFESFIADAKVVVSYHTYPEKSSSEKSNTSEKSQASSKSESSNKKEDGVSIEFKNALKSAQTYSDYMHMSKQGIYDQLVSEYGEKFPADAAQYAIDNVKADWNKNALETAKDYQETMSMSKSAIYDQLISEYGEKFTASEAQYAIDHLDD